MDAKVFSDLDCSNTFKFNEIVVLSWVPPHLPSFWSFVLLWKGAKQKKPQKPLYTNVWVSDWILLPLLLSGISEHSRQRCTENLRKLHICISAVLPTIAVTWMDLSLVEPIYPYATCQSPWKTTFTNKKTHSKWAITRHCAKNRKNLQYLCNDLC